LVDTSLSKLTDADLLLLLTIRRLEEELLSLFSQGRLNGTTHTCLGQEYIPVALQHLMTADDFLFTAHRGHGHYVAQFGDVTGLLAEIMGREGGVCNGVGGSQHLYRDRRYLSTGIQGESLPVAAGVAHHFKRKNSTAIVVAVIGDGTWGEGAVYEALNMTAVWCLPLIVLVENNGISQTTPTRLQMAGDIKRRAAAFDIDYVVESSKDVNAIRARLAPHFEKTRECRTPLIVEIITDRLGPHSKGDDSRDPRELERIRAQDWYALYQQAYSDQCDRLNVEAKSRIAAALETVEAANPAIWGTA